MKTLAILSGLLFVSALAFGCNAPAAAPTAVHAPEVYRMPPARLAKLRAATAKADKLRATYKDAPMNTWTYVDDHTVHACEDVNVWKLNGVLYNGNIDANVGPNDNIVVVMDPNNIDGFLLSPQVPVTCNDYSYTDLAAVITRAYSNVDANTDIGLNVTCQTMTVTSCQDLFVGAQITGQFTFTNPRSEASGIPMLDINNWYNPGSTVATGRVCVGGYFNPGIDDFLVPCGAITSTSMDMAAALTTLSACSVQGNTYTIRGGSATINQWIIVQP